MAKTLANCAIWLDSQAIASSVNQVALQTSAAEVDVTTMLDQSIRRLGGLEDSTVSAAGFWDSAEPDNTLFGDVGSAVPITIATALGAVGSAAYILNALEAEYGPSAAIGAALGFQLKAAGNGRLASGILALNGTFTTTGVSAIYQLPAGILGQSGNSSVPQKLVAALHVLAVSGSTPTFVAAVKSAATGGFGSPTTRATFNSANALGSQLIETPGPITDTFWRIDYTITGTTPSFTVAAALGIAY